MRRRQFVTILGGTAAAWLRPASAQQKTMPVMGFLSSRSPSEAATVVAAFHHGLGKTGYVERQNLVIEYRWAKGRFDLLPALAADLVGRKVDVIVATGGAPSSLGLRPLRCQIDLFSRLLRVFLSQRVQRVTRCKSQVQKDPKHHWPLRGEAVFSPTEAAAEPAAPGIAPRTAARSQPPVEAECRRRRARR